MVPTNQAERIQRSIDELWSDWVARKHFEDQKRIYWIKSVRGWVSQNLFPKGMGMEKGMENGRGGLSAHGQLAEAA